MPRPNAFTSGFYTATLGAKTGCGVKGCRNSRHAGSVLCSKHYMRWRRHRNPKLAAFNTLRDHAKARKIEFTISFEYFLGVTDGGHYWDVPKDNFADFPSIDRKDACKGYVPGNLHIISISANAIKSNTERYLPEHIQAMLERKRSSEIPEDLDEEETDCPF